MSSENEKITTEIPGINAEEDTTVPNADEAVLRKAEDAAQWTNMLRDAKNSNKIEKARTLFETLVAKFPLSDMVWLDYARAELQAKNYQAVENILGRSLITLLSVGMWEFYVAYVQLRKLGKESEAAKNPNLEQGARQIVTEAFEFALDNIGYAYEAGSIWQEYIKFVETAKVNSSYDLGQRTIATKGVYQRAVRNPVAVLEDLYKNYSDFEKGNVTPEIQQEYNRAALICAQRKKLTAGIDVTGFPDPDLVDERLLDKWKTVIEYEKSNPEQVSGPDLKKRVRYIYNMSLRKLMFSPEMWYDFSCFEVETYDPISARTVLETAIKVLPDCMIMYFALADANETNNRIEDTEQVYETLVKKYPCPLAFIQFMQFCRRVKGVQGARAVFRRARQSAECDATVFAAAANMEFFNNKDSRTARNVYELGMKRYPGDIAFILQYIHFLEHVNRDTDLIALFERAIAQLQPSEAFPVWEKYREFKTRFTTDGGNLKEVEAMEKRMFEAFRHKSAQLTGLSSIIHRYTYLNNRPALKSDILYYSRHKRHNLSLGPSSVMSRGATGGFDNGRENMERNFGGSSKTPLLVRKLESYLPDSLGDNVKPMDAEFVLDQISNFRLPPKSVLIQKKKRRIVQDVQDNDESTDIFKKRRKVAR